MDDLLDLTEAARILGIKPPSLRKRLNSTGPDRIAGVKVRQGDRDVWRVSRAAVEQLAMPKGAQGYQALIQRWENEQASGYHTGKPLSPRTIQINHRGLHDYWRFLSLPPSIEAVTPEHLRRALSSIPVDYKARTCHHTMRDHIYKAVLSLTKLLIRQGLRPESDLQAMRTLKPRRVFPPRRTSLKPEGLDQLFASCERLGGRTEYDVNLMRTAIYLMALGGLRRAEVCRLEIDHINLDYAELRVIDGKGHKDRLVGMPPDLVEQVRYWLNVRKPSPDPQLLIMDTGRALTINALALRMHRLNKATGLDITLHGLRRTCATLMVDAGVPLVHVQRNLGHRQISTTMAYVRTDEQTAAESFKRFRLGSSSEIPTSPPVRESRTTDADMLAYIDSKNPPD